MQNRVAAEAILEARGLTKLYGGLKAISDISFGIHPGDILGYLGPNGSGKSTTVKVLTGLLAPTTGQVLFRGHSINDDVVSYKRQVGYAPEEANLYTFLTGAEYLELVGTLRGMPANRLEEKIGSLLNDFAMYPHRYSPISSYSKGMRQRIMLIAALMHDPDVLILDEPFSGLDVTMSLTFRTVIKLLAQAGKAIFFCSPVLEVVDKLCTHLVLLTRGQVVAYGEIDEIRARGLAPALEDAFLQLTEQFDAQSRAVNIVAAVNAPCY